MRLVSWNVNGLRAVLKKDFLGFFEKEPFDVLCLQEVKAEREQVDLSFAGHEWHIQWNPAIKKGYSGVATFTRSQPLSVSRGLGIEEHDQEGRVLTLEFPEYHLVNVYTPNSQNELRRLAYRQEWDAAFLRYLKKLETSKPVVACGDFNVAHEEIDLARPQANRRNAGFTDEERAGFSALLREGFIDTFRLFQSGGGHYSWWSYRANARANNVGWRIDYWLVSQTLQSKIEAAEIRADIMGSDHCPVALTLSEKK
ncbi:MAG: exodeoxyribonuclease III [Verrucomicrobiota bacterium]